MPRRATNTGGCKGGSGSCHNAGGMAHHASHAPGLAPKCVGDSRECSAEVARVGVLRPTLVEERKVHAASDKARGKDRVGNG